MQNKRRNEKILNIEKVETRIYEKIIKNDKMRTSSNNKNFWKKF